LSYNSFVTIISASEARAALPELLTRVEGGEKITITRHGRAVAALVPPEALRSRRSQTTIDDAGRVHDLLTEAGAAPLPESAGLSQERAEELIAAIRASRDAR
jgi:prevent-host-death family protein